MYPTVYLKRSALDIEKIEKLFIFFVKNVSDAAC
jgi:hypothetical protein